MININEDWYFQKLPDDSIDVMNDYHNIKVDENRYESIDLPHTWYKDGESYDGTVIYKKIIYMNNLSKKRAFLNFKAADRWCKVFVNGIYAGEHKGGYSAFTFDITEMCKSEEDNEIIVLLDNRSFNIISPLTGDFTVFGGLYRAVDLIFTEEVCFDRSYYGTSGVIVRAEYLNEEGNINIEPHVIGTEMENIQYVYKVIDAAGKVVSELCTDKADEVKMVIKNPLLWDGKEKASIYILQAEIQSGGNCMDAVEISFGFRNVAIDAERGFQINGNDLKINGVAKHQDHADVFNATGEKQWQQDINDILEIGANSVRLSHYQHPQEMYDLCDQNGLIVWAEIPMLKMNEEAELFDNACEQMKELILQNIHHPSICFWGIQNEIAMFEESEYLYVKMKELNTLVKDMDNTRITTCANLFCVKNESELNKITDSVGYNIYFGWYYGEMKDNEDFVDRFHVDNPDIPLGISEYGVDCNLQYHSDAPRVKDYTEEFQALYHETVYPIFRKKEYLWGTYVWNLYDFSSSIRDEGGVKYKNCKGLISFDRKIKKDSFYYYKAQWSSDPFVKIAESRFVNREKNPIAVKVYSNQKEIKLSVNGKEYVTQSDNGVFEFENIMLQDGENNLIALSGECTDNIVLNHVEEADASYVYVDNNPGLNVKNWFLDAVEEEKMFPKGKFSIRDSCKNLVESAAAMRVIEDFNPELAEQMRERIGMMPLERILNYKKKEISEEQCKELNARLICVDKEEV